MCLAVVQPKGIGINPVYLENGFLNNPDGAGFAFVDPETNKTVIRKGFFNYAAFENSYNEAHAKYGDETPFLIHFRWKTHGAKDWDNCHPFKVKDGAMIHNGVLNVPSTSKKSDTMMFAEKLGAQLDRDSVLAAVRELGERIGPSNKLAFLYDDKTFVIVNEKAGIWRNGSWFSNTAFSYAPSLGHGGYSEDWDYDDTNWGMYGHDFRRRTS